MSTAKKQKKGVVSYDPAQAYKGYTLVAPQGGYNAYLIDMEGRIVHHWPLQYQPCFFARLLPNGNLLYQGREEENVGGPIMKLRGPGGEIVSNIVLGGGEHMVEVDRQGKEVWRYDNPLLNHDFFRMKNGHTMLVVYVKVPDELKSSVIGGLPDPMEEFWADALIEVDERGEAVWEWQPFGKLAYGDGPLCPLDPRYEWTHANTCTVLDNGDVLASFRNLDIVCIIDRQTGDIKWKWGPGEIAHQHEPVLLENGNVLIFDNGEHRRGSRLTYSRAVEVDPRTDRVVWEYVADPPSSFFSGNMGGAERLPNGNTLIADANYGRIFEVTREGEIVWDYMCPFYGPRPAESTNILVYRAYRFGPDHSALAGLDLDPEPYRFYNAVYGPQAFRRYNA